MEEENSSSRPLETTKPRRERLLPTAKQAIQSVVLSQWLTFTLQPIELVRYNPIGNYIYIIGGVTGSIEIIIFETGEWEFRGNDT